ncbi:3D domain-containing protein [Lachnospiraceae bacterium ASD3451]|uniref:3D domain-containing protein n=1 Tax=Diplocloster agilis TaxID=2850323 RepID=UPI001DA5295D|nr:3D domain-containing protein [Diplocloster agilis]MBU9745156.1 3D domain-containing protein [Diplocloster agilis]DAE53231.1 MAG TPA: lytic transglycosylase [Caudoviricetes sp.]
MDKGTRWGIIIAIVMIVIMAAAIRAQAGQDPQPPYTEAFESTAYCETGNPTSSGKWPREGVTVAVDPDVIPLGSAVMIWGEDGEWMGIYEAQDTGRLIKGRIIDLYMDEHRDAVEWGRKTVYVRVITGAKG